jgi:hypothetical protein
MVSLTEDAPDKTICVYNVLGDRLFHPAAIREEDILAEDWEITIPEWFTKFRGSTPLPKKLN